MIRKFDAARLAQLRDTHSALRGQYARSAESVQRATADLAAARREAPPRVVNLDLPKHAFAVGIRHNEVITKFTEIDEAYERAPIELLQSLSDADLAALQLNIPAVKRIIVAGQRLQRLRIEHSRLSTELTASCAFMARIEDFAKANRL